MNIQEIKHLLGNTDMYLIDLLQKGYFDQPISILDVGCGTGRNLWMFSQLRHSCVGVDKDPKRIELLNAEIRKSFDADVRVRVGELGVLSKTEPTYDFVICNAVLHFAKSQPHFEAMFRDLIKLAKGGGKVFCRFVSSHTLNLKPNQKGKFIRLPDGTHRFVVDYNWLIDDFLPQMEVDFLEVPKTVNINDIRSMTTLVLKTK